jgi:hypothetical protein
MVSIWFVIVWALIMLTVAVISFVTIRHSLKESVSIKASKLKQTETELVDELKQINFDDLKQTESGKQLLKLLTEESPHITEQFSLNLQNNKKEITPTAISVKKAEPYIIQERVGNITLLIEGLPMELITPKLQAQMTLSFIKHGLPTSGTITAGVMGGVKTAVLEVGGEYYQVKYSIKVSKTITALDVYQEAVKWIESQRLNNRIEPTMANDAIDYLRNEFKKEFK